MENNNVKLAVIELYKRITFAAIVPAERSYVVLSEAYETFFQILSKTDLNWEGKDADIKNIEKMLNLCNEMKEMVRKALSISEQSEREDADLTALNEEIERMEKEIDVKSIDYLRLQKKVIECFDRIFDAADAAEENS